MDIKPSFGGGLILLNGGYDFLKSTCDIAPPPPVKGFLRGGQWAVCDQTSGEGGGGGGCIVWDRLVPTKGTKLSLFEQDWRGTPLLLDANL